jgi:FtsP/CotA-like multicopper oxidase with cupredoxin domain
VIRSPKIWRFPPTSRPGFTGIIRTSTASPKQQCRAAPGLAKATPTAQRSLYFSETPPNPGDPDSLQTFFITVDGAVPTAFDPANPPAITTTQGSVEDWTISNRASEVHEFHIHQIHFLLMAINGVPVPAEQQQFLDMVQVP